MTFFWTFQFPLKKIVSAALVMKYCRSEEKSMGHAFTILIYKERRLSVRWNKTARLVLLPQYFLTRSRSLLGLLF